jgi:hypothetical protein
MKVYMKPIEMIAWFTKDGKPHPIRYKFENGGEADIIAIGKIVTMEEEKLAGNRMLVFKCESIIDGVERIFELKYELSTCKWFLYKM